MRPLPVFLALGLFLALSQASLAQTGVPPTSPWSDPVVRVRVEPALLRQLATADSGEHVPIIVYMAGRADRATGRAVQVAALQAAADVAQRDVRAFLDDEVAAGRAEDVRSFWIFNGLALAAAPQTALQLAARPDVELLRLDRYESRLRPEATTETPESSGLAWGVQRVHADQVWHAFNDTGANVVVANMDTGVDFLHPDLNANYRGNLGKNLYQHTGNWFDATADGANYPHDGYGHGTHTMGTMVGGGGIGVAPGARWIAVRVLDNRGYGRDSWIHAGFQWLLAPGGDPEKAPQIVNNSWGNDLSDSTEFQQDIEQLRQAGIAVVFSAGNSGPAAGTLTSPAALPGVLAVGAIDSDDDVASFSSRGPSPWGEVKPQLAAPGVGVVSSYPGGGYATMDGTSMAAPHVAGVMALMLSANPGLTIPQMTYALTSTAVALESAPPTNTTGWGRVDAYAAVQAVAGAGTLSGSVIDSASRLPLPGAQVSVQRAGASQDYGVSAGEDGHYAMGLAAGPYRVTAGFFGYRSSLSAPAVVVTGTTTSLDFALDPLPVGILRGTLTDLSTNQPATVTVSALGTPAIQTTHGLYQMVLPEGTYSIQARGVGYRVMTTTVTIEAGQVTQHDFGLTPTERILLVNSGAWYQRDYAGYYRQALDGLGYAYDEQRIKHLPADTPTGEVLDRYDLVIWSAPEDSPGYVGASQAITRFLTAGGKLLLSGQDVAYWDGGGSGMFWAPYLSRYLMTDYVQDEAGSRTVTGRADGFLAPLKFSIAGGDGADNQYAPDAIAIADGDHAESVLSYEDEGVAGNKVGLCLKYRALVLPFGYEAVQTTAERRDFMQRALDYFVEPGVSEGLSLTPLSDATQIGPSGSPVTFTVRVQNVGEAGGPVDLQTQLQSPGWAPSVTPARLTLAPCATATLTVTARIPAGLGFDERNPILLRLQAVDHPALTGDITLTAKTPAPVLLVDHRRWYDGSDTYSRMLDQAGIGYDLWKLPAFGSPAAFNGPPLGRLSQYPVVVWLSGFDWYAPVNTYDEQQLSEYLDQGGRLLLSSAFYLDLRDGSEFARQRLGVLSYSWGITATATYGSQDHPLGAGFARLPLADPFPRTSFFTLDRAIAAGPERSIAWRGDHHFGQALASSDPHNRLAFWAIPLEALPESSQVEVLQRTVGWLGPLGDSTVTTDADVVRNGERATLTLTVRNNLWPTTAWLTATLPPELEPALGELPPGLNYDPVGRILTWHGPLATGGTRSLATPVRATTATPRWVAGKVTFSDERSGFVYDQPIRLGVDVADLRTSTVTVSPASPGHPGTIQMVVRNAGPGAALDAHAVGLAPLGTRVITGTTTLVGPGKITETANAVTWRGALPAGDSVTFTYQVSAPQGSKPPAIPVELLAWDSSGGSWEWRNWLHTEPSRLYCPVIRQP